MAKRRHIIIAESSAMIRCGLLTLIQRTDIPNIDVAELSDLSEILSSVVKTQPDILIVSPQLMGQSSISQLRSELGNESLKVVALQSAFSEPSLLSSFDDIISIYDSIDLLKSKVSELLESGVESTDDGGVDSKKELSAREKEIIVCVVKGMTNKVIAETLFLSTHTVIAHRRNIANKLQIFSPSGLTIYAIVNKLVDLADIKSTITH